MKLPAFFLFCILNSAFCISLSGCGNPHQAVNAEAQTTFLTSTDLQTMTDQMAQSIIADPYIQQEWTKGPMKIVIKPVSNETNEIITDNRKELFVARLQGLLDQNPAMRDKFTWIINRSDYAKLRAEELPESQLGPSEDRIQPEYALWAVFLDDTKVTTKGSSNTYLCQYKITRLSGPQAGIQMWTGQYETSKQIKKTLLD